MELGYSQGTKRILKPSGMKPGVTAKQSSHVVNVTLYQILGFIKYPR